MEDISLAGLILVLINCLISYQGLRNHAIFDKYAFRIEKVLLFKEYYRLISSSFLHVSWKHLAFNMFTLLVFSTSVEYHLGIPMFLILYFGSMIGGDLLSLFIHRNHSSYSAVGASGAVSGVVFASIALFPGMEINMLLLPIGIPAWIYGFIHILITIYGVRSQKDNIGHDAHLGGAIVGMLLALIMKPNSFMENYFTIVLILVPCFIFFYFLVTRPEFLYVDDIFAKTKGYHTIDDRYNTAKLDREKELDGLLDKIHKKGMGSLSEREKARLKDLAND